MPAISSSEGHFLRELLIQQSIDNYCNAAVMPDDGLPEGNEVLPIAYRKLKDVVLNVFFTKILQICSIIPFFTLSFRGKIVKLLTVDSEAKHLLRIHRKVKKIFAIGVKLKVEKYEKVTPASLELKIKATKYETAANQLEKLPDSLKSSDKELVEKCYHILPKKIKKMLVSILHLSGVDTKNPVFKDTMHLLQVAQGIKDASGKDVFRQIAEIVIEKKKYLDDLILLNICLQNPQKVESIQFANADIAEKIRTSSIQQAIEHADQKVDEVNAVFTNISNKINMDLSVYEVNTDRLVEKYGKEILDKPVTVTMVGVEYAGLIKEGGLAEAIEGLSQGLLKQHNKNKVRLIFPKFSVLPSQVLAKLENAPRTIYKDHHGHPFSVVKLDMNGVECHFIEHPDFTITSSTKSIYSGNEEALKQRFVTFSSLAADLLSELPKTDIIHLHDWHVAGVELKLRNSDKKIAPIVFTYHNNQRAAQGRYFNQQYNYEPVMKGLQQAGIAKQSINMMVDAIKKADSVTTVSSTFAVESQSVAMGEGVSFAMREAAKEGKLHGIVNGTDTTRWDPAKDQVLKNWKSLQTAAPQDLTYGAEASDILEKKAQCKQELQAYIAKYFPNIPFDCNKPIVTFIGRYDYYQKGLDTFDRAIKAALKNGAQVIMMGTGADPNTQSKALLDRLQQKYKSGLIILQDYKTAQNRLYYQQGDQDRPGIGSLVRAATDITYLPSRFEPCGLVQFEAWLFGSLVLASSVGGFVDTVRQKNSPSYNGYLFDRKAALGPKSLEMVMKDALDNFRSETPESRLARISRTMREAKLNGWNSAPSGYSPTEKYRFVYENAKAKATEKVDAKGHFDISRFRRIMRVFTRQEAKHVPLEESYLQAYYSGPLNEVKRLYKLLPEWLRKQMPTPYARGVNHLQFERLGALYSPESTTFRVEAPNAAYVDLILYDEKGVQKERKPMTRNRKAVWELRVDNIAPGTQYQYAIDNTLKIDPYGLETSKIEKANEVPKSKVIDRTFSWNDQEWVQARETKGLNQAMSIYELHPSTWKTTEGKYLNYREIAEKLVAHSKQTGFTHVELMGILEHPHEGSQGYQITNYFSPNSRMGTVDDLKYMINYLHQNNIGVILDWVPNHFAKDDYALTNFDGTNQFESSKFATLFSLRSFFMAKWGTKPFNFRKKSVRDFLISSASYWIKEMHIDGLRVDAVEPLLGSEHPKSARKFLREFNETIHTEYPGVITIAEDTSGALEVTKAPSVGGYGFDLKWNMNWIWNLMAFLRVKPHKRSMYYDRLVRAIEGDTHHKMVLGISHDDVGRSPLVEMTPGLSEKEKIANLKAVFSLQMCLPGKKLFFMGSEVGSHIKWADLVGRQQGLLDQTTIPGSENVSKVIKALTQFYKDHPDLWKNDDNATNLEWIEKSDFENSFIAYRRLAKEKNCFAFLHNFSATNAKEIEIPLSEVKNVREIFNSNAQEFGGDGSGSNANVMVTCDPVTKSLSYKVVIQPLSCVVIEERRD